MPGTLSWGTTAKPHGSPNSSAREEKHTLPPGTHGVISILFLSPWLPQSLLRLFSACPRDRLGSAQGTHTRLLRVKTQNTGLLTLSQGKEFRLNRLVEGRCSRFHPHEEPYILTPQISPRASVSLQEKNLKKVGGNGKFFRELG